MGGPRRSGPGWLRLCASGSSDLPGTGQGSPPPTEWLALDVLPVAYGLIVALKKAPHPYAARILLNWELSEEGQRIYGETEKAEVTHPKLQMPGFSFPDLAERLKNAKQLVQTVAEQAEWKKGHPGFDTWQRIAFKGLS